MSCSAKTPSVNRKQLPCVNKSQKKTDGNFQYNNNGANVFNLFIVSQPGKQQPS
jgi:hypothetical protein